MTATGERTFEDLLARIDRREQTARRRAILYTIVPVVMAAVLLGYTAHRIQSATAQLQDLRRQAAESRGQVARLETQITDLQAKLGETEARLKEATELGRYIHQIDFVDVKAFFSLYPQQAPVLERILELRQRGVKWHLGGQTPTEGFDSPSFAAFILRELNLPGGDVRPGENLLATSRRLWDRLPPISQPRVGDLAFYPAGYVLFYFLDQQRRPFVIGMTPFGITALNPDFAKVVGYRRIGR